MSNMNLLKEYLKSGYIAKTCKELLEISDQSIINFYKELAKYKKPVSPVKKQKNSKWMIDYDFCFINVRAAGGFINAAKLLPGIRTNAIHLAPFTTSDFNVIYAINSIDKIDQMLGGEKELKFFVDACHSLGKVVGFDIEPHVSQYADLVLQKPELFRWVRLSEDKNSLFGNISMDEMLREDNQKILIKNIKTIVKNLKTKDRQKIIVSLINNGYWTVPSHTWCGVGVPEYKDYNHQGNHVRFKFLDKDGVDVSHYAYNIVTPYKFYNGVQSNKVSKDNLVLNKNALNTYSSLFDIWKNKFGFDFVRFDSLDHVFDSIIDKNINKPTSDRPTPYVIKNCIKKIRSKKYIGTLAERIGTEINEYYSMGFDLMLGYDMMAKISKQFFVDTFSLYEKLCQLNKRKKNFSVVFAIDTHDTGDPGIYGDPLIKIAGSENMKRRLFVSRFISVGKGRRPKYEVMGFQDLSYGLYQSNVHNVSLNWVGDKDFNKFYHQIEDIYSDLRPILDKGEIIQYEILDNYCWWAIKSGKDIIVPVVYYEDAINNNEAASFILLHLKSNGTDISLK